MSGPTDKVNRMATLTDRTIQNAKARDNDAWLSDGGARGAGRLYLRVQASGRKSFYFRCSGPEGERQTISLGEYSQKGSGAGLSLTMAREKAGELERLYRNGNKDLKRYLEGERLAREQAIHDAEMTAKRIEDEAKRGCLRKLLDGYTEHLERAGKVDTYDVKSIFRLHVFEPWPDLAARRAADIKPSELNPVIRRLTEAAKKRTAAKLRSYLRAAFAAAMSADSDSSFPVSLMGFGIETNPAAAIKVQGHSNPGDRTLTEEELRCYLWGIDDFPLVTRTALRVALYLGGQRPTQLLRASPSDVEMIGDNDGEIRIYDLKGARKVARVHVLPLHGQARADLSALLELKVNDSYLFASGKGAHLRSETMAAAVAEISTAMLESGRSLRPFQMKDIRRTCETMLARLGVSKDIRAQLLSHGLGGVQAQHYDRHEYMAEKRTTLLAWAARLDALKAGKESDSNVVEIRRGAA